MSDYGTVKEAMKAGTPPELICASCPWDRLCITPPSMTGADIERHLDKAKRDDEARDPNHKGLPTGQLLTALMFGGRDNQGALCPVFAVKLRSPDGRQVADTLRKLMQE
jgi:hypothetical protein